MRYNVKKKKNAIRSKMKPTVNENEMSTNADVMGRCDGHDNANNIITV